MTMAPENYPADEATIDQILVDTVNLCRTLKTLPTDDILAMARRAEADGESGMARWLHSVASRRGTKATNGEAH
jgi:hypothetical protein